MVAGNKKEIDLTVVRIVLSRVGGRKSISEVLYDANAKTINADRHQQLPMSDTYPSLWQARSWSLPTISAH